MNVLITGGAGFIGSSLATKISSEGHMVYAIDNLHTGKKENLRGIKNMKFLMADSGSVKDLQIPVPDVIMHLGMPSSAPMYESDKTLEKRTVEEFEKLLEFAKMHSIKVIFASTSSLYGKVPVPHSENLEIKPFDGYTRTRYSIEKTASELSGRNLKTIGLRLFSVYGSGEKHKGRYANVISQFMWSVCRGRSPVIYADGTQTRDFIYIDDVVRAFMLAMEHNDSGIFNVGTGKQTSFNTVVTLINQALGKDINPVYVKNPIANYVLHTMADCRKSSEFLGFRARYDIQTGIKKLAETV